MGKRVELILGPPGTGKTTTLHTLVEKHLNEGVPPDRMAFVSFSKRAIDELVARWGHTRARYPWFRTIHSTAFRLLELSRECVLQTEHLVVFGTQTGTPFKLGLNETEALWDGVLGDQCLGLYSLARARSTSVEAEWRRAMLPDLPLYAVTGLVKQYEAFKHLHGLVDFHDMITNGLHTTATLPVDVLFVDEAQDTSAAQWAFLRHVARDVPVVYIAGDDDQAVYGWSGADAEALLRFQGSRHVLPVSHRLPVAVKALADRVVSHIRVREPKVFAPKPEPGAVEWRAELDSLNLHDGATWLLLARSNYQLKALRTMCRQQGVVYTLPGGEWSWSLPAVRAAVTYERLRKGGKATRAEAKVLWPFTGQDSATPAALWPREVDWATLYGNEAPTHDWMAALRSMPGEDREYVRALRRSGESLTKPGRVRVSTVHGAKGAEARNVVLCTDISKRVAHGARVDPDAERRVQYVGVTRAAHTLYLMQPTTATHWQF